MKTINFSRAAIVGFFIFIAVAFLIAAIFTIGGDHKTFTKTISIKAVFDDVSGLQEGNNVWLYGVKIGTIKKISFYTNNQVEVTMNIEKNAQPHIRKDALVKIGSDGLIGNKIVIIYGGTTTATIDNDDFLHSEKSINSDDIIATLQTNNKNLVDITGNLKNIIKTINSGEGTIGKLINDPAIANKLNTVVSNFKTVSANSEEAVAQLDHFVEGLNKDGTLANKLITDTILFGRLTETMNQLNYASININALSKNIKTASEAFNKTDNTVGALLNDPAMAENMKTIAANLSNASKKLDNDLEAVQHNFLFRGYFKKLAKKQQEKTPDTLRINDSQ